MLWRMPAEPHTGRIGIMFIPYTQAAADRPGVGGAVAVAETARTARTGLAGSASTSIRLGRQLENLPHLGRPVDGPRIARHPRRAHRLLGDAIEMLAAPIHLAQASGHAEPADEIVEHVAGILPGMAHGVGDQRLALGVGRLV